jgi:hypothetical protein
MRIRASQLFILTVFVLVAVVGWSPTVSVAGERHAGTVLRVDAAAGSLVLDEYWIGGQRRTFRARLTPETRVILSERNEAPRDLTETFTTSPIKVGDLKFGDFVVIEMADTIPGNVADLVMVTLPAGAGS